MEDDAGDEVVAEAVGEAAPSADVVGVVDGSLS
jgi:hypothetical protein